MATLKRSQTDEDRLSDSELEALRQRVGDTSPAGSSVRDVAEATGMSIDQVRESLERIRAEQAFAGAQTHSKPWLLYAGLSALALAAFVTFVRSRLQNAPMASNLPAMISRPVPSAPVTSRPLPDVKMLPMYVFGENTDAAPTPGMKISIVTGSIEVLGQGAYRWEPLALETVRKRLKRAFVEALYQAAARSGTPVSGRIRDLSGNPVTLHKGFYHYSIGGWIGTAEGNIPSPNTDPATMEKEVGRVVDELLSKADRSDLEALRTDVRVGGPRPVQPPPGFAVSYGGRRLTDLTAAKMSFPPYDLGQVRKRLVLCMKDLIVRDLRPPEGRWDMPAEQERKIPIPKSGHFRVRSPQGDVEFDVPLVPSGANPGARADKVLDVWAAKAAEGMKVVNHQATESARE